MTRLLADALRAAICPVITMRNLRVMVQHHGRQLHEPPRKRRLQMNAALLC